MKCGKLPTDVLKRSVLNNIKVRRPEVLVHSAIGEDCSVIDFGEWCSVLSTDPITGTSSANVGRLAVHISCNDVAACGVEPLGILVTILAPESVTENDIHELMNEIGSAASEINVEILGGHTEITQAVNKIIVSTTAIGRGPISKYVTSSGSQDGDYILVTKFIGLEGTSILASDYESYLKGKMDPELVKDAKEYIKYISVAKEGIIGGKLGASSMHDATEGGLLGALWEIAEASNTGFEIYRESIPMKEETRKICEILKINPLRLISSGMMIMTVKDKNSMINALKGEGIEASCIGRIHKDSKRRVIIDGRCEEEVLPPESDELFNVVLQ